MQIALETALMAFEPVKNFSLGSLGTAAGASFPPFFPLMGYLNIILGFLCE
jgi:hypothetical protein